MSDALAQPDVCDGPPPGRFVVVTGAGAPRLGRALAARLDRAALVEGDVVGAMFVSAALPTDDPSPTLSALEQLFVRYSATIAAAETFQRAGYDAVVVDSLDGDRLDDFLDFCAPNPVHVVRCGGRPAPAPGLAVGDVPDSGPLDELVADTFERLDDALVITAEGPGEPAS